MLKSICIFAQLGGFVQSWPAISQRILATLMPLEGSKLPRALPTTCCGKAACHARTEVFDLEHHITGFWCFAVDRFVERRDPAKIGVVAVPKMPRATICAAALSIGVGPRCDSASSSGPSCRLSPPHPLLLRPGSPPICRPTQLSLTCVAPRGRDFRQTS